MITGLCGGAGPVVLMAPVALSIDIRTGIVIFL